MSVIGRSTWHKKHRPKGVVIAAFGGNYQFINEDKQQAALARNYVLVDHVIQLPNGVMYTKCKPAWASNVVTEVLDHLIGEATLGSEL